MRLAISFSFCAALLLPGACAGEELNFDDAQAGSAPQGWSIAMTHKGGAPKWEVRADPTAPSRPNVLAQISNDATAGRFPLAIWDGASVENGTITVRFKAISGRVDQGAGLVWRYHDPNNYYIVRANALEDNVVLYKVHNGERLALAPKGSASKTYGVRHNVPKQTWSTLSVRFQGNLFTVSFDGQKLFDVEDATFSGAGKTGLWTKSDSVIYFDNFQIDSK